MKNKITKLLAVLSAGLLLAGTLAFAADDEPIPEGVNAPYGLGNNMLPDSTFDGASAQWTFAGGSGASGAANVVSGDRNGKKYMSLAVTSDGEKSNSFQPNMVTTSGTFAAGDTYVFSFWVKAEKVDAYSINSVWLRSLSENKSIADKRHKIPLICDGQWHYYAVPFKITEAAEKAKVMIQFGAQGKSNFNLGFDDIRVRPIRTEPPLDLAELTANKKVRFEDISGHWAENEIKEMASMGILNGRDVKTFDPEAPVTRAEMVVMLVRGIGYREAREKNPFLDSKRTDWYVDELDIVADVGLIDSGMLWQGNFFGEAQLKREELAMFIANSYDKMTSQKSAQTNIYHFKDRKEISDWAIPYIMNCTSRNLMEGTAWDYFEPQSIVTRAQAATAIYRLRTVLEEELA